MTQCNLVDAWPEALAVLSAASPQLATLAARFPDPPPRAHGDALLTLMRAIAGQQISTRAADAIWARLQGAAGDDVPTFIAAAETKALRQLGLSRQKAIYLKDLVEKWRSGALQPDAWEQMTDAELIRLLTEVRGIGRWTAEMFLWHRHQVAERSRQRRFWFKARRTERSMVIPCKGGATTH